MKPTSPVDPNRIAGVNGQATEPEVRRPIPGGFVGSVTTVVAIFILGSLLLGGSAAIVVRVYQVTLEALGG